MCIRFDGGVDMTLRSTKTADKAKSTMTASAIPSFAGSICCGLLAPGSAARPQGRRTGPSEHAARVAEPRSAGAYRSRDARKCATRTRQATFSGNVQVMQGDTTMKCKSLVVFLRTGSWHRAQPIDRRPSIAPGQRGAEYSPASRRSGGVTVVTKDQNATGDLGVFDMKTNTVTLTGNVVVSQGQNVLHGERVVVDTVTGECARRMQRGRGTARPRPCSVPAKGPERRLRQYHDDWPRPAELTANEPPALWPLKIG